MTYHVELARTLIGGGCARVVISGYADLFGVRWLSIEQSAQNASLHYRRVPVHQPALWGWVVNLLAARFEKRGYQLSVYQCPVANLVTFVPRTSQPYFDLKIRAFFADASMRNFFDHLYANDIVYVGDLVQLRDFEFCRLLVGSGSCSRSASLTAHLIESKIIDQLRAYNLALNAAGGRWQRPLPQKGYWTSVR